MARRSSTMEDVVEQCNKRVKHLNLEILNSHCNNRVSCNHAKSLTELESNINDMIVELNNLGNVRFAFINGYKDYERNFRTLHGLRSSEKYHVHHLFKELLEKHMKLSSVLNHQSNVLTFYLTHVKEHCKNSSISDIESLLMKCLTVCNLIPPVSKINSCDEELNQYQNIASILKCCHKINLTNSHIVAEFLRMILKMHLVNANDAGRIRHENYDNGFLQYIICHAENESISLKALLSQFSETVWRFCDHFSILNAMVDGDRDRMLFLLSSGVQIFPQHEEIESGHRFEDISQILTRPQLTILYIMERIIRKNMFDDGAFKTVTEEQRKCFEIIWQRVPGTLFPTAHFMRALKKEHQHLLSCGIEKEKCGKRRSKATRFVRMYVANFYDIPKADYKEMFISLQSVHNMQL